ncbi:MAG: SDR family NAD(P)-dependent oxidoreductase [Paludibacteraceae bacterium]|nr:SDR family NAD(P)-dependent oxidoreductase [Paludibacteraceae bacterium]
MNTSRTLLLTGGSGGIGKATAELFAARGWQVYELSRHGSSYDRVVHVDCDVTSPEQVHRAVDEVLRQTDHIDVVISNAGMGISGPVEFTPVEEAKRQFDVNFFGALYLVQAVLPTLRNQQRGRIIFTSSVAAVLSVPYQSLYSASKAALNAMALALANEVRPYHIQVSCLMPGDVATGFTSARAKGTAGLDVYPCAEQAVAAMEKDEQHGMSAKKMATALWRIATSRFPAPLNVGGWQYKIFCLLDRILPKRVVNRIEGMMYS